MKKLKTVKVETPWGVRSLVYRSVSSDIPQDQLICDSACPYSNLCSVIRDPSCPEDTSRCYNDFCSMLGENEGDNDSELLNMVPVEGTIESFFSDGPDIYSQVFEKDPSIKLSEIKRRVCKCFCDDYDENSSEKCVSTNKACILSNLFSNRLNDKSLDD